MHDEQLHALIGATRADGAVDIRRRGRWLQRQLQEEQTFLGAARTLVAGGATVEVWTVGGRTHRGALLAADEVVVVATDAGIAHVKACAVVGLRPVGGVSAHAGRDGGGVRGGHFVDVLAELAERRAPVALCGDDGQIHRGVVEAVGRDVVRLAGADALLRLDHITEVVESPCG